MLQLRTAELAFETACRLRFLGKLVITRARCGCEFRHESQAPKSTVMRFNLHVAGVIPAEFGMSESSRATFQLNSRAECEPLVFLHCDDLALCSCDLSPRSMRLTLAQQNFAGAVSPNVGTSESSQS